MERKIDRFDKYMESKGLNDNIVTHEADFSIGSLGKSRKEGKDLSNKSIEKISKHYPDLSKEWLLNGVGKMIVGLTHDPDGDYKRCEGCAEKGDKIRTLNDKISFLNESVQEYKTEVSEKDQQIGKLKSILEQNGISYSNL
jgi:hypothetical protein